MAHPYNSARQGIVEHQRVKQVAGASPTTGKMDRITGNCDGGMAVARASGGAVRSDASAVKRTAMKLAGGSVTQRSDRPGRAPGGMVGGPFGKAKRAKGSGKGKTNINIVVGGPHAAAPPGAGAMPPGLAPPPPAMPPPKPPMMGPPPGGPPMAGAPGGPGPMGPVPPMRARGGKVKNREDGGVALRDITGKTLSEGDPKGPPVAVRRRAMEPGDAGYSGKLKPDKNGNTRVGTGEGYARGGAKRASGGKVDANNAGAGVGRTPVQHTNSKQDGINIGRKKVVTY